MVKKISDFLRYRPKCVFLDIFVMNFGFLLRIFISDLFVKHLRWYFGFLYTVT